MPHNRTRIWVGLAIVAVTIPAVAQYYYGSTSRPSADTSPEVVARNAEVDDSSPRLAMGQSDRDYMSEVSSALAKGGSRVPQNAQELGAMPLIYEAPVEAIVGQIRPLAPPAAIQTDTVVASLPPAPANRATSFEPEEDETIAVSTDAPQMSDRTVYQLVLDNLPEDDRDTFVRAWAVMTPEERASLMDDWRTNLENRG